jgi:hypothetical protein
MKKYILMILLAMGCSSYAEPEDTIGIVETNIPTRVIERESAPAAEEPTVEPDCDYSSVNLDDVYDYSKIDFSVFKFIHNYGADSEFNKLNEEQRALGCVNPEQVESDLRLKAQRYPITSGGTYYFIDVFVKDPCRHIYQSGDVVFQSTDTVDVFRFAGEYVKYSKSRKFFNIDVDEYSVVDQFGNENDGEDYGKVLCVQ